MKSLLQSGHTLRFVIQLERICIAGDILYVVEIVPLYCA